MGVLEQVMDLKNKGVSDNEIIGILKEKGASPKSINDALSQAKIKGAISKEENDEEMEPSVLGPEGSEDLPTEGSISDEDLTPIPAGLPPSMQQRGYTLQPNNLNNLLLTNTSPKNIPNKNTLLKKVMNTKHKQHKARQTQTP